MRIITPRKITKKILECCKEIDPAQKPFYVPVIPDPRCKINECFWNVKTKVEKGGGKNQFGWSILETPNFLLEAEFHSVWVAPKNQYIDITPNEDNRNRILFLSDPSRKYDYEADSKRFDNYRWPLVNHPKMPEFIQLAEKCFALKEKYSTGCVIQIPDSLIGPLVLRQWQLYQQILKRKVGRNDSCPCGSGKKFKKCCGQSF